VATVIVNEVAVEARPGERLLNIARRDAAHIGFVCDGNGICQMCQVRVLSGAEHLNAPTPTEQAWMPEWRLANGHRLACQAALRGPGPVEVLTTVEELRRQTLDVIQPPAGVDRRDALEPLLDNFVRLNVDQLIRYPLNIIGALLQVKPDRLLETLRNPQPYIDDTVRITQKLAAAPFTRPRGSIRSDPRTERLERAAEFAHRAREAAEQAAGRRP
jgi:ferredoxin